VTLEFCVTDSGIGIPAAQHELLFRPFSQVDSSIARRHGGTGLGLAICKGLVSALGGQMWVRSEPGAGSKFYFTLPTESAPAVAEPAAADNPFDGTLSKRNPLRILVAEDNGVNRRVVLAMLNRFGYEPDIVVNGREALEAARRQPYDVVLMDIQMPEVDGLDARRAILALDSKTPPRIIGLSANAMAEDVQAARQAGMIDYLAKPIEPGELRRLLEKWGPT
jgi:CheY-like chemotaxis protein